jgi:hypothetical protein
MAENYRALSAMELLHALEMAGRAPDLDLIRTCLEHRYDLTAGLLDMLAALPDEEWEEDDPRWYAAIHAGHLLIHFREPQAIPIFMRLLRGDNAENLVEWFENALASYGLAILPAARALLNDPSADEMVRIGVPEMLQELAAEFPTERAQVIGILRDALPALDSTGKLLIPKPRPEKPNVVWSFVALALAKLHDFPTRPLIETLYREHWIDESVMGNVQEYLEILMGADPLTPEPFNIIETYEGMRDAAVQAQEWAAKRDEILRQQELLKQGAPIAPIANLTLETDLPSVSATQPPPAPTASLSYIADENQTLRRAAPKVGRNDPCPCGSGRKYKQCHGKA